jgi:hypothetical protein
MISVTSAAASPQQSDTIPTPQGSGANRRVCVMGAVLTRKQWSPGIHSFATSAAATFAASAYSL